MCRWARDLHGRCVAMRSGLTAHTHSGKHTKNRVSPFSQKKKKYVPICLVTLHLWNAKIWQSHLQLWNFLFIHQSIVFTCHRWDKFDPYCVWLPSTVTIHSKSNQSALSSCSPLTHDTFCLHFSDLCKMMNALKIWEPAAGQQFSRNAYFCKQQSARNSHQNSDQNKQEKYSNESEKE